MPGTRVRVFADGSVLTMFSGFWTLHQHGCRFMWKYELNEIEEVTL